MNGIKKKKPWKRRLKKLIVLLVVLGLAAGAVRLFVWPGLQASATTTYGSYTATTGTISNAMSFSGNVNVQNSETFTAASAGTVREIYVSEEQEVKAGDRLMRLTGGQTLEASFDGRVNSISVEEGDEVAAGATLIQVVDFNDLTISMRVDEYDISSVYVGQPCTVNITALDLSFDSELSHIDRISSSAGGTAYYTVTAAVTVTDDVLPGMQATVTIPEEEAVDAVILNKEALSFDETNSAYVLMESESGEMERVYVETGVDNDNYVEITSGLEDGDTVYVLEQTQTSSGGGLLSSLFGGGGGMPGGGEMPDMSSFGGRGGGGGGGGRLPRRHVGGERMAEQFFHMQGICKSYHLADEDVPVLRGIDLDIEQGEYLSVLGPSGSGKSTLMNIIGCLDVPTEGEYILHGQRVEELDELDLARLRGREIGFIFQNSQLLARLDAQKNVEQSSAASACARASGQRRATEMLERVGLADRRHHFPSQLSGGQQQRVAIARALVTDPTLLLADEPTGALDQKTGRQIMELFGALNSEGRTIIMITHDLSIARHARRVVHIIDGELTEGKEATWA